MSDDGISALMRAAARVASGDPLTNDLLADEGVPVSLRLVLAAAVLVAADRPISKKAVTAVAPAARSATYRDHAALLEAVTDELPALVRAQLGKAGAPIGASELARQLQEANKIIAAERKRREQAERQLQHMASYARELHWRLKPEFDAIVRERTDKVRPLRAVASTESDDDKGLGCATEHEPTMPADTPNGSGD